MTLQDLFDQLLLERQVLVELSKQQAESLRVQLSKKLARYKKDMGACGFLSQEMEASSLCKDQLDETSYKFSLAKRKRPVNNYVIIDRSEDSNAAV